MMQRIGVLAALAVTMLTANALFPVPLRGQESAVFPVYVHCGIRPDGASPPPQYSTLIEVTLLRPSGENGEFIVSPEIMAGEINPGETVVIGCNEILSERSSYFGYVTVQVFPDKAFRVRVTYEVN